MERHPMRKIREVLRLRFECQRSHREISAAIGISEGSVCDYLNRARTRGLSWAEAEVIEDNYSCRSYCLKSNVTGGARRAATGR